MAHVQEGRGIHLPFHQEMENCLAHIYKTIDSHVGPNLATNAITRIEDWFEENIRQPIARGIQRARR